MPQPVGIHDHSLHDTPYAVIDFETTGLSPGYDRAIEMSIVRLVKGRPPELVFDSLINPLRRVCATEIHGIRDRDVIDAPTFSDLAPAIVASLAGCVVVAYNAYFDMGFLRFELDETGCKAEIPYICAMWLRPLLGVGERCRLGDACRLHSVAYKPLHHAHVDAVATAYLFCELQVLARQRGIERFGDLAKRGKHKYLQSFRSSPLTVAPPALVSTRVKSRAGFGLVQGARRNASLT